MICRNGWRRAFQEQEAGRVGRRVTTLLKLELKDRLEPESRGNTKGKSSKVPDPWADPTGQRELQDESLSPCRVGGWPVSRRTA